MAQPNDSIAVTPGSGATVATHAPGDGKEYQVVMIADATGHILDTLPTYYYQSAYAAAAQNKNFIDIFNASGSGKVMKIRKVFMQLSTATVTGVATQFDFMRTTAVFTSGTVLTAKLADSTNAAVPAQITARHAGTSAGSPTTLFSTNLTPEETQSQGQMAVFFNLLPEGRNIQEVVIREGEGFCVRQITSTTAGTWSVFVVFTLE